MDHAEERELEQGLKIRLVAPVYFCASKLEAFAGRGKNDFQASRDLEDLIAVVDGRGRTGGRNPGCGERCAFLSGVGSQEVDLDCWFRVSDIGLDGDGAILHSVKGSWLEAKIW